VRRVAEYVGDSTFEGGTTVEPRDSLSPEQERIAVLPRDTPLLVLAGPGTGKTHTLLGRVGHLLSTSADGSGGILILSFTRAVVRELHERLRRSEVPRLSYLRPVTFDSFATRLLRSMPRLDGAGDLLAGGFEDRILAATRALHESEEAIEWFGRFDHVVVDEIQDLVGVRAEMVLEILSLVPGFDLFGDPAQGIYGWQQGGRRDATSDEFLAEIRRRHASSLVELELDENHRMSEERARMWASVRPGLMDLEGAAASFPRLREMLAESESAGSLSDLPEALGRLDGRTAILCRTNVEAMMVSEALSRARVDHDLRRVAGERVVPAWVASIFASRRFVDEERFLAEFEAGWGGYPAPAEHVWELLIRLGGEEERVGVEKISAAIRDGTFPDELSAGLASPVVVSTIHRAKGLEFENAVVVEPESWRLERGDPGEEARILFVAMTRARRALLRLSPLDTSNWSLDDASGRWVRSVPTKRWMTIGLSVEGGDIHHMHPAGTWVFEDDPRDLQAYLSSEVKPGDPLTLNLVPGRQDDHQLARYELVHGGRVVGVTGEAFTRALSLRLAGWNRTPRQWPRAIEGLRVESVDTVAGLEGVGEGAGLGRFGLWLRPRPIGLGRVVWAR